MCFAKLASNTFSQRFQAEVLSHGLKKKVNFFLILLDAVGWMGWSESIGPGRLVPLVKIFTLFPYMLVIMSVLKNVLYVWLEL